jgi:hypothetical protein
MDDMPDRVNLNMLISEYQASLKQGNKLAMRMEATATCAFLLLTLLTVAILQGRAALNIAVAWFAPLPYLIVSGALIGLASQQVAAAWQRRILAIQLRRLGGEEPLPSPAQDPLNLWRMSWKLRLLVGAPAAAFAAIFLLVAAYCLRAVYAYSHIHGLAFFLVYLGLALVELLALAALYSDLPAQYHAAYHAVAAGHDLPLPRPLSPWNIFLRWALPFPGELLNLSRAFWVGFLAPLLLTGLSVSQLAILNRLFRQKQDWPSPAEVPFLAVIGLGVLVYLVTVLLLQQGIAIGRALRTGGAGAVAAPVAQVVLRILAALALGYLLAGRGYLLLLLAISIYEIIHLLVIWLIQARQPFIGLLWQAASLPLYFAAGVLVWGGPTWDFTPYVMLAVIVFFLSLAMAAAGRRRQARALEAQGQLQGDDYFMQRGEFWRQVGLWAAFLASTGLFAVQAAAERCAIPGGSLLAMGYAVCKAGEVSFTLVGKVNSLLIGFDALVLLLVVVTLLVRLLGPHLAHLRQVTRRSRALASPLFYLLALAAVIVGVIEPRAGWALGGVALGILGAVLAPGD